MPYCCPNCGKAFRQEVAMSLHHGTCGEVLGTRARPVFGMVLQENDLDVWKLFKLYNVKLFRGSLRNKIRIEWTDWIAEWSQTNGATSPRSDSNHPIVIRLHRRIMSNPLLTRGTLVHEMIHSYLILKNKEDEGDSHGPNFQAKLRKIQKRVCFKIPEN